MKKMTSIDEQIGDLLLTAKGLELVRELLKRRGASVEEIDAHSRELDRVRHEIAETLLAA
jgi:hypothetical protein